jgi:hypothetical protein
MAGYPLIVLAGYLQGLCRHEMMDGPCMLAAQPGCPQLCPKGSVHSYV